MSSMMPLAFILPEDVADPLRVSSDVLLEIFAGVSFLCVVLYVVRRIREGRLVNNGNGPFPVLLPGPSGALFSACVVLLIFLQSPLFFILVLAGMIGVLLGNGRSAWDQFGLGRLSFLRLVSWSLLLFGAVLLVETPLTQVIPLILEWVHLPHPEQESVKDFGQLKGLAIFLGFLQVALISPAVEELFFRGFLQTYFKNYTSTWLAIVLSSGIFAFAHMNLAAAVPLWVLGMVLGLAYEHTGCLLLPIGIHACWNFMSALNLLVDKGSN